jgi:flavorubredoxin
MRRTGVPAHAAGMLSTNVHEIADGVYRLSTLVPEVGPGGFTFNQFLITGDEPTLFHTGARQLYPLVSDAVAKIVPVESLRWISFGHVESDECGAMNQFLAAAPSSEVAFNQLGCDVSLRDLCDRPPVVWEDAAEHDIGGHVLSVHATPHVPHGWEAQVLFDRTTRTLFCGDLLSQTGDGPAIVHDGDVVAAALATEDLFGATGLTPATGATIRRLAALEPRTLAVMHGPTYAGDCVQVLHDLADAYDARVRDALEPVAAR